MPIYVYQGNKQISTNAIRNNKAVKAIYAKEQEQEAVCVWGVNLNILPFTYTKSETSIIITGLKSGVKMKHLRVPETVEDLPVTEIESNAFKDNTIVKSIALPNFLKSIGRYAFMNCTSLTSIRIGNGLMSIDYLAFNNCSNLQNIYITDIAAWCNISGLDNLTRYGTSNKNLYVSNELITALIIPNGVTEIPSNAFWYCTGLTSVTISDSVKSIGSYAFRYCSGLISVTIGKGVTSISNSVFEGCSELTSIYYTGDVASWCGIKGLDTITSANWALYIGGKKVEGDWVIPNSVTSIEGFAFANRIGLTSVTISDSVTSIGLSAFSGCTGLMNITFNGTKTQWNAISKKSSWNSNTGNYTIHCTDGDIPK